MREVVRSQRTGTPRNDHEYAALLDSVLAHTKWPMRWLLRSCRPGGAIPRTLDNDAYQAAIDLSKLSRSYSHFEAAFTYASLGVLTLMIEDRFIRASDDFRRDTRYDAYDRLRQPRSSDAQLDGVDALINALGATVRVKDQWFFYDTGPKLTSMALDVLSPLIDSRFRLPDHWTFARFSLADFRAVARVIWVLAYLHFNARVIAAMQGCVGLGYARALYTVTNRELLDTIRTHSKLSRETVVAVVDTLTFGAREQHNPDPALQPLIALTPKHIAIAPNVVVNSSIERNLAVLLNRLPVEQVLYTALSMDREALSRNRVIETLNELGYRYWYGKLSEWGGATEVDLAIISDAERCCVALEMKAFIAPADPREVHERSLEIKRGIEQARERQVKTRGSPLALQKALRIDHSYEITWAVASETSIGPAYVQSGDVPVVQTQHVIDKLRHEGRLAPVCEWLKRSGHLPIEGKHYSTVDLTASVGDWSLPWYAIRALVADYV